MPHQALPEKKPPAAKESPGFSNLAFAVQLQTVLEQGGIKDAIALFDNIPEEKQEDPDLKLLKASLYFSDRQYDSARALVKNLSSQNPGDTGVIILQAKLARVSGDVNTKNALIKKVLAAEPFNPDANLMLADDQMLRKNFPLAKTYFQTALKGESENLEALVGAGEAAYFQGIYKEAASYLNAALQIDPELGVAYSYLSKLEEEKHQYAAAISYMEKAIRFGGETYEYMLDYGLLLKRMNRNTEALTAWKRATEVNPRQFLAFAFLASLQDEIGDTDNAFRNFQTVVKLNPNYFFAWESMGIILWQRGEYAESRQAFSNAWNYQAANISYPMMMAATYYKEGKPREAREILSRAMKPLEKSSPEYAMARLYFDSVEQGILTKVLNTQNSSARYRLLFYLGLYYECKGQPVSALKCYEQVQAEARPSFFEYRLNGWALEALANK